MNDFDGFFKFHKFVMGFVVFFQCAVLVLAASLVCALIYGIIMLVN